MRYLQSSYNIRIVEYINASSLLNKLDNLKVINILKQLSMKLHLSPYKIVINNNKYTPRMTHSILISLKKLTVQAIFTQKHYNLNNKI